MEDYLTTRHRVLSYELDSFGHVNNSVYLNYLEKARNDFMLQRGLKFSNFQKWKTFPVVRRAELDFLAPLRADQEILIQGKISTFSQVSFTMEYQIITLPEERPVLRARTEHVFVNPHGRPCRLPEEFCQAFGLQK